MASSKFVFGFQASVAHIHYAEWQGVLPEPYASFELKIQLNTESDDVETFSINMGSHHIQLSSEQLSILRDVELGTTEITHEMYNA
jgi:2-phospho-L-lactate guanylyltransferase (CobY/MobA/RfbA family)